MSKNCVLKGTLITLKDDITIKIEDLKVGEKLLSYSVEGIENTQDKMKLGKTKIGEFDGEFSYQLIKNIWKNNSSEYFMINDTLGITGDHFVICKRQGKDEYYWIKVEDLIVGDSLFKSDGNFENINNIELINEGVTVYNIQVNSVYSYFANDYLIHNGAFSCDSILCSNCYKKFQDI